MTARTLDGATVGCGGREFTVHDEPPDEDGHGAFYYTCDTCDATIHGGSDKLSDHECQLRCPECDAPGDEANIVSREHADGSRSKTWQCCGENVRCPSCGGEAVVVHRYSDELGGYCTRCPWTAAS